MLFNSLVKKILALPVVVLMLALAGCGGGGGSSKDSPSTAPAGFTVTPIESGAVITWNQDPGLEYWVFYAAASSVTPTTYSQFPQPHVQKSVDSPLTITGLTNGTTYAFVMNSTRKGSPAGPATASIAITPVLAGSNWTAKTPISPANLKGIVLGLAGNFVAVGSGGSIYTSADSLTWTAQTSGTTNALNALTLSTTTYVAVGANGTILTSTDNVTWTAASSGVSTNLNGVSFGNSVYVAVGDAGRILTSADGVTWTSQVSGTSNNLNAVAYVNSQFVAVGDAGRILTSADGVTWTAVSSGSTANLYSVSYIAPAYLVVGANGTILSSTDSTTWTVQTPTSQNLYAVAGGLQFIAVGANGTILYGLPSSSWTVAASGTSSDLRGALYSSGFIAVGNAGANTISR